jgi:hypothetical protein
VILLNKLLSEKANWTNKKTPTLFCLEIISCQLIYNQALAICMNILVFKTKQYLNKKRETSWEFYAVSDRNTVQIANKNSYFFISNKSNIIIEMQKKSFNSGIKQNP